MGWKIRNLRFSITCRLLREKERLSAKQKVGFTALILCSYEDFLNKENIDVNDDWFEIKNILQSETALFIDLINYWDLTEKNDPENNFKISALINTLTIPGFKNYCLLQTACCQLKSFLPASPSPC